MPSGQGQCTLWANGHQVTANALEIRKYRVRVNAIRSGVMYSDQRSRVRVKDAGWGKLFRFPFVDVIANSG